MITELITEEMLEPISKLFINTFNDDPWNDDWTLETAQTRLQDIYHTPRFEGMVLVDNKKIVAMIMGRGEQYFDGIHFQILEFCVEQSVQRKGYGSRLLNRFMEYLLNKNIQGIYLLTMHGESTEGFYEKNGFAVDKKMCLMNN